MANIKSAKKRALQTVVKRKRNVARKSAVKTAIKKVLVSIERGDDASQIKTLMQDAEAKLARAGSKGVVHKRTASRKISRLALRVAAAQK